MGTSLRFLAETHTDWTRNTTKVIQLQENNNGSSPISTFKGFEYDSNHLMFGIREEHLKGPSKSTRRKELSQDVKWKQALQDVANISGYPVGGNQAELVRTIVSKVTQLLKTYDVRPDDDYLVGMEQPVQKVVEMLQIYSSNVQIIGICGMPGIGKTTLAKVVYNKVHQHYDGCSFVSRNPESGLCSQQNQLITQLLKKKYECNSFEDNIKFISHRFENMRVLIVLDNVESLAHIKAFVVDLRCFGPGSKIILTTQKPEDLVEAKVDQWYTVQPLDDSHALQLFKWHAFGKESPEGEYIRLSAEIASETGGIPSIIRELIKLTPFVSSLMMTNVSERMD